METQLLVQNCLQTSWEDIPEEVKLHGKRSLFNWMGVAIGASEHETIDIALHLKDEINSAEQVSLFGRSEKVDILLATLLNGMSSHIFDFDDTHLDTIHHPSGPVAPVVMALGEKLNLSGKKILHAFILGCEAELRIANAVYPSHYQKGWHITSSTGVFGSAIAAGILLDLNEEQLVYALGLAGTQTFGLREMFGSMTKPFHPGKAAQNGLLAALLAKHGFTSSKQVLEAKRGFANVTAPSHDLEKVNVNWGTDWELLKNSFKPYACGIVLHPSIDACIAFKNYALPDEVERIELTVNPYVLELTGKKEPKTGLEGKFSIYHTASIAFLEGDASEEQYSNEKVLHPDYVKFREKIFPIVNDNMAEDKVDARMFLNDGRVIDVNIENATGSIQNPMTDEALKKKFNTLTKNIINSQEAELLTSYLYTLEHLENLAPVIHVSTKKQEIRNA